MNRHERIYRRLLRLYPADFRARFGNEMISLFREQLRDARSSGERNQIASMWARCLVDLVVTIPKQHFERERQVAQVAEGSPVALVQVRPRSPIRTRRVLLSLLPLWVVLVRSIVAPGANEPLFANPPAMFGLPLGFPLLALAFSVMAIGVVVTARATSMRSTIFTFAFLTAPAIALAALAPAIILLIISVSPQTGSMP
jgi:hypothetical protein